MEDGSVEFENVSFRYSEKAEKNALEGINLKIKAGETVGILGGTGSSKSSLVQLIPRLYDTTEGVVRVGGRDVRDYDLDTLRNQVAFVLQKNVLFSGTIKENLRWGDANATDEEITRVCKLAQADDFIQTFPEKYDTYIEQGGTNVSGGAETAALHRACAPEKAEDPGSGRLHQRGRYKDGRADPQGVPRGNSGYHEIHHRAARRFRGGCG